MSHDSSLSLCAARRANASGVLLVAGLLLASSASFAAPKSAPRRAVRTLSPAPPLQVMTQTRRQTPPRSALLRPASRTTMRATAFVSPLFPAVSNRTLSSTKPVAARSFARPTELKIGGGKIIKVSETTQISNGNQASPTQSLPPAPHLAGMKKVIKASDLTLPPLSAPLPQWMRSASVRVDRLEKRASSTKAQTRLAQNPTAPPLRQPARPVTNSDRLSNQIEVSVSTFVVLLTTTDLQTVAVADPTVADVAVVNSRAVLLNGKSAGTTSLVIVDGQKIRQYNVRVTGAPGERPVDVVAAIGVPGITVRQLRDTIVLGGEGNEADIRRAVEIAGIYAPKVINQVALREGAAPGAMAAANMSDLIAIPGVTVRMSGETAILSGQVQTPAQIQEAEQIARLNSKNVLNLLRLPPLTVDQVRQSLGATAESVIASANQPGQLSVASPLVVRESGGQIVLDGVANTQTDLDLAIAAANRTGLPIVNRLTVRAPLTAPEQYVASVANAINQPGVKVSGTNVRLVLEGTVADTNAAVAAEQIARGFAAQVDNLLQTRNPLLVDVDISIVEITNNALQTLGFQYPSLQDASATGFVLGQRSVLGNLPGNLTGQPVPGPLTPVTDPAGAIATRGLDRVFGTQTAFQAALRAEARKDNVRLLSNPRTTVLSGRTATFQVGGQVPIPVSITQTATGTVTSISFKDFGVLVDVVPNATATGNVTMRLRTEVSQPDPTIGFTPFAGSSIIPGFIRRSTVSEVTIPRGGTIALGGLISTENRQLISKVPVLSSLPLIGSLFKSKRFVNNQSELVIFVSTRVINSPLENGSSAPAGVVAAGNTTNVGTILGNPGIPVFNSGIGVSTGGAAQ